jgi:hypothetical protein
MVNASMVNAQNQRPKHAYFRHFLLVFCISKLQLNIFQHCKLTKILGHSAAASATSAQ